MLCVARLGIVWLGSVWARHWHAKLGAQSPLCTAYMYQVSQIGKCATPTLGAEVRFVGRMDGERHLNVDNGSKLRRVLAH